MSHLFQLKKQMLCLLFSCFISVFMGCVQIVGAEEIPLESESAVLMEPSTGTIILEKNKDERKSPASITKIMTLLLIFEELESGRIHLEDEVVTSAYAKSMGGSQVFLEEGEVQTVQTMIKCIAIASGNDASVAMAEKIAGSEADFVERMNQKAAELGMKNTHFLDCCGLSNSDEHYTSAYDVAIMARELIVNYPEVFDYTKIWMEDIVHETPKGSSTFTLSSTNKLLKQYEYTTGLKTGSTDKAKYCFCATAKQGDMSMIAVVMAAPDYKIRFAEARQLMEHGFQNSSIYKDENRKKLPDLKVVFGVKDSVSVGYGEEFTYLDTKGRDLSLIEKEVLMPEEVSAPIREGDKAGEIVYSFEGEEIGRSEIVYYSDVERATYMDYFKKVWKKMLL